MLTAILVTGAFFLRVTCFAAWPQAPPPDTAGYAVFICICVIHQTTPIFTAGILSWSSENHQQRGADKPKVTSHVIQT